AGISERRYSYKELQLRTPTDLPRGRYETMPYGCSKEAACVRSNRISPWFRSGDLDVAELGLLNIAFTQRKRYLRRCNRSLTPRGEDFVDKSITAPRGMLRPGFPVTHYVQDRLVRRNF